MAVGDVEDIQLAEFLLDGRDQLRVVDHVEDVAHAVVGRNVVLRPPRHRLLDQPVDGLALLVGQEDRAGLGVQGLDVALAVTLLVLAGQLVLLDHVVLVVLAGSAGDQADLHVLAPYLLVDVKTLFLVLEQGLFVDEAVEIFLALGVHLVGVEIGPGRQVDLGLADVQERIGIALGQLARLLGTEDVVGRGGDLFGQVPARPEPLERFYACHYLSS